MPNNPPFNAIVDFLVFQTPYIFTKFSGISVANFCSELLPLFSKSL